MISVEEWERRALELQAEIENSLGNLNFAKNEVDDEDLLLLESLNSKAGKYLLDDLSLSDIDDLDLGLNGEFDDGQDFDMKKPPQQWPSGYSSLCLKLTKLNTLSSSPTSFWLEIGIPGLEPIRTRISRPKIKTISQKSADIKLDLMQSISLDIPVESLITFKLFAVGAPSGIPTRSAKNSSNPEELWVGVGSVAVKEILLFPGCKATQTILVCKEKSPAFKPSNVLAQIDYELSLVPSKPNISTPPQENPPEILMDQVHKLDTEEKILIQPPVLNEPIYLHLAIDTIDAFSFPMNTHTLWAKFKLTVSDEDIITPTVSILGTLEPRFDYKLNRPIPWSILERMKYPLIIEIHSEASLIGLVRVPIHNLAKSFIECRKGVGIEENFAIVDVISGERRGFIGCKVRIGEIEPQTKVIDIVPSPRLEAQLQPELASVSGEEVDSYSEKIGNYDNGTSTDSVLQITIHKATGLATLIESLIPTSQYTDILLLALDHTPNVYITLDLFGEGDSDSVTSPIVSSFAPGFGYKVEVTVECVDVELVNFLRSGKALGRVWHRVPRHLQSLASEVLLGTFEVEMADLIKGGIRKRWVGVKNEEKVLAGVCLSMSFEGYEVGVCPSITTTFECKYDMQLQGLDGYVNYTADGRMLDGRLPYKSEQIEFENHDLEVNIYNTRDVFLGTGFIGLSSIVQNARNQFRKTQAEVFTETFKLDVINTDSHEWLGLNLTVTINVYVTRRRRDRSFQKSFMTDAFKESFIADRESLVDISKIDVVDVNSGLKVADSDKDSITKAIEKVEQDIYQILPQTKGSSKANSIGKEILKVKSLSIPVVITVEKATNLPLMQDPLASSLQSPFVKVSETKTALANASCSFNLPEILGGGSFQSNVIQAQSNPIFNFATTANLIVTRESLDTIKHLTLEIQINHHLPLSFTSSNSFVSDLEMELVGTVKVELGVLFSLDEIYGWYDLMDGNEGVGQVLVRVSPEKALSRVYKELDLDVLSRELVTQDESLVMEEVFEWDGNEWVAKMVPRPKIKAKSLEVKQKGNLSLENALGEIQDLHSSMMERFRDLGLGNQHEGGDTQGNGEEQPVELRDEESRSNEGQVVNAQDNNTSVSLTEEDEISVYHRRKNNSNPFLENDQSRTQSEFMDSVQEHSDLPLHGEQYLLDSGFEVGVAEPDSENHIDSGLVGGDEKRNSDDQNDIEKSDSSSSSSTSNQDDHSNNSDAGNESDSDSDSFDGKLSISKSKPPLPPSSTVAPIGLKELPPRVSIKSVKSEIEKRLGNLSIERSKRIAKILRDT